MRAFSEDGTPGSDERRWMAEAERLGLACAREVHGDDVTVYPAVVTAVRIAAASLWRTRKGKARPRWSRLRVKPLVSEMRRLGLPDDVVEEVLSDLFAFFTYLRLHGRMTARRSLAAQQRLWPYVSDRLGRAMEQELGVPASAVTSVYAMNELAWAVQAGITVGSA